MNTETNSTLDKIKSNIEDLKKKNINEAQTKEWLIKPFFAGLGWDFSNPNEVIPEDDDGAGKKCDYTFCVDSKPVLLVEAKSLKNELDDNKMILEKLNYCTNTGIPLLIITNGNTYKIYYSELKGVGNDKLLNEFTILSDFDEDIIEKLSKESFKKKSLLNYAKNIYLYTNIKKAVEQLFQSNKKSFINEINSILKEDLGHKFGDDEIFQALKQFRLEINTDIDDVTEDEEIKGKSKPKKQYKDLTKWTIDYQFKGGRWSNSYNLYKNLIKQLRNNGLLFEEKPTKQYIGLTSEKSNFCQIHGQKSRLKLWLNINMSAISKEASLHVRDVTKIGHWGMGNIECTITNESDFEWVIELINKAYKK